MKKLVAILLILALMPILPMAAQADASASDGIYEGEYDADGKRSGYGTWTYHNYLYEGFWENDLPNGLGALTQELEPRPGAEGELYETYIEGQWIDGYANGTARFFNFYQTPDGGSGRGTDIPVRLGYPIYDQDYLEIDFDFRSNTLMAGVPPWAPVSTNSAIPAPSPSPNFVAYLTQIMHPTPSPDEIGDGTGVYEGEYDADGKRSGQGTWTYHNHLYVGHWENDMPNGEGTLYYRPESKYDGDYNWDKIVHGNWVNGHPDGTVEWTLFSGGRYNDTLPTTYRVEDVEMGYVKDAQYAMSINGRRYYQFFGDIFTAELGCVAPWGANDYYRVEIDVAPPWDLYEKYPTGKVEETLPKIKHTGMGFPPGNLANAWQERSGFGIAMAALGDWIFFCAPTGKGDYAAYKMRPDGSQMVKLYESKHFMPNFQVIGDWLYINEPFSEGPPPSKMRADDFEFTTELEGNWFHGVVIDDWEYRYEYTFNNEYPLFRHDLASTKLEYIAARDDEYDYHPVVFADEDWVYVCEFNGAGPQWLVKISLNGSSKTERHQIGNTSLDSPHCGGQVVGGRIYYSEGNVYISNYNAGSQRRLLSVDLDFSSMPMTIVKPEKGHTCGAFNVTDDYIYYADMYDILEPKVKTAIIRVDHDGSNPVVLADGLTGYLTNMFVAGDWMAFALNGVGYMMRLDGGGLHKIGEAYVPEDAPGVVDSTGKWRYELLPDGSATILGPGSKLKQTGKLSIPATVDKIPVTAIGENAFYGCDGFTSVTIPKSVTTIGDFSFFWCKGLTGVTIPEGVVHIGSGAFQYCSKIKKVSLPASLTSVDGGAFAHCPTVKLSVAKKNETFEIVDGALFDRLQNRVVD